MKIDIVSIFPDYLAPLELSLPGKARAKGLLDISVHDLRDWAGDKHHTTDDTPYGGGAGMVMKAEPWGVALDEVATGATIIFTTPSGQPFTQAVARELADHEHLVFACGRYEGIDQRVIEHAASIGTVREISLGDYVLNGGEVAALAITEAVVRLVPGFMGNAASLVEESHEDGLLEYPVYTKPASWRGHDVPAVLLSGDHAKIAAWRHDESVRRTAERRPDLVAATSVGTDEVRLAVPADAGEILTLQLACWVAEQRANPGVEIHALRETLEDVRRWLGRWTVIVRRRGGRLGRGGTRSGGAARRARGAWDVGRLMVAPDLQGQGLGRDLLARIEGPRRDTAFEPVTGAVSLRNQKMYQGRLPLAGEPSPTPSGCTSSARRVVRLRADPRPPVHFARASGGAHQERRDFARTTAIWQTRPLVLSAKGLPRRSHPGGPRRHLPQGVCDAAGHAAGPHRSVTTIPRLTCGIREESHHDQRDRRARQQHHLRTDVPAFRAGDTINVHVKVVEGSRSRVQSSRVSSSASTAPASAAPSPSARSPSASASSAPSRCTPRSSRRSRSSPAVTCVAPSSTTCATCAARPPRSRSGATSEPRSARQS